MRCVSHIDYDEQVASVLVVYSDQISRLSSISMKQSEAQGLGNPDMSFAENLEQSQAIPNLMPKLEVFST